tara:strand:+ start:2899 stop:3018 length:120 start_codon:yes stop_codon:yes gene_type:complete
MGTALAAAVTLYRYGFIQDFELALVLGNAEPVAGHNSYL